MTFENVKVNYNPEYIYTDLDTSIKMSHVEVGPSDGKKIVLIHGAMDSYVSFSQVAAYLADLGYHVYLPELRGHGNTDKVDSGLYTVEVFSEDIKNWFDKQGLKDVIVGGHSYGSLITQRLASERPELVKAALLLGTGYQAVGPTMDYLLEGDGDFPGFKHTQELTDEWKREFLDNNNFDPEFKKTVFERAGSLPYATWYNTFVGLAECHNEECLPKIKCPVQIIWGSEDDFFEKDAQDFVMTHLGSNYILFINKEGYAHDVHWCEDMGKEIAIDIDKFIKDVA